MFARSSKGRLTRRDAGRFASGSLFDRIARVVCEAGCLPRKELYEAWEVARRTRRLLRGGRVVDLASGHGVLAQLMLLLDDSSPDAIAIDKSLPPSTGAVHDALVAAWPRLSGRVSFIAGPLESVELRSDDVVVSSHACGALTDLVIERASAAGARMAVLPCCHDAGVNDAGALKGWVDAALAIDIRRVQRLEARGYDVRTQAIPSAITPKNRLIVAARG